MKSNQLWRLSVLILAALSCPLASPAQQPGGQGGQGGGTTGGSSTGPSRDTTRQPPARTTPDTSRTQDQLRPFIQVVGSVVLENGTPPPMGTAIERDCGGRVTKEAYVDSTGHYSFQLGGSSLSAGIIPDASESGMPGTDPFGNVNSGQYGFPASFGGPSSSTLMGCELRARLEGHRSSTYRFDAYPGAGPLDAGTLVLHPTSRAQGNAISVTNLQAPKGAKKSFERGQKALEKNNLANAEKEFQAAVAAYPKYADGWLNLGQVYQKQQRVQDARDAYGKAVEADAGFLPPYIKLAKLAALEQKWQELANITDRAVALDPLDFPEAYFFSALAYYNLGDLDMAEASAHKEQRLDSLHRIPQIHLVLANIRAKKNDSAGSREELKNYLKYAPTAPDAEAVRSQLQKLEDAASTLKTDPTGGTP